MSVLSYRILHTEASLGLGGQEIRILTELAGLIGRNHQATLVCPPSSRIRDEALRMGLPATALPIGRKNLAGLRSMSAWLRHHPVDVVISHSSTDSWLTALATRFLHPRPFLIRVRHISTPVHDNLPTRWLYQKAAGHVITTGECIRRQLIDQRGHPPERVTSIPTGIDLARFTPGDRVAARHQLGLPREPFLVGIVASMRDWKGHQILLEAFKAWARPDTRLVIVGEGDRWVEIKRRIAELDLGELVFMPGNQADVAPWLQALDLFVLPSLANEGVPQVILQAMACGLPVIGSAIGGIPEVIDHGMTGLLVPPGDVHALRQALVGLMDHPEQRLSLGLAAQRSATPRFGVEVMLDHTEELLHSCLRQNKKSW
ncbi:MAG: glycosyltransferase family 4 protein [Magnetococcales bacterium]|nr:glycosyltransferase family 4 protein [Magnetococcales bacterium]MBF0321859.1 glycosyltransferase family 4 protein [Magnetococcales bacterium]